jgi:AcrR family transcriptional regulator
MNLDSSRRRPRSLRAQMRETVAQTILDAAEEVIAAKGLHHASLLAIARRAGIAVGTLYNYYKDRDDLVRALFEARRAEIAPRLTAAAAARHAGTFEERLLGYTRDVLQVFDDRRRFLRVAIESEHQRTRTSKRTPLLVALLDGIAALIAEGVAAGALPPGRDEIYTRLLAGSFRAVVLLRTERDEPMVADAEIIVETFLHGAA